LGGVRTTVTRSPATDEAEKIRNAGTAKIRRVRGTDEAGPSFDRERRDRSVRTASHRYGVLRRLLRSYEAAPRPA